MCQTFNRDAQVSDQYRKYTPKVSLLLILLFMACVSSQAQVHRRSSAPVKGKNGNMATKRSESSLSKFTMDVGLGYHIISSTTSEIEVYSGTIVMNQSYTVNGCIIGIYGYSKYHFWSNGNLSASVGIPVTIGMSERHVPLQPSSNFDNSVPYRFGLCLPVMADLNFGAATPAWDHDEDVKFGGYIGVGFGLVSSGAKVDGNATGYYNQVKDNNLDKQIWAAGPMVHAGVRTKFGILPLGFKVSYMPALGSRHGALGLALYVPL